MRVVHVLTRLLKAGSEENTFASCRAQVAAGHDVHVVHGGDFDPDWHLQFSGTMSFHRVESLVHPLAPVSDLRAFIDLRQLFTRIKPDIVHTHQSKAGIVGRFAARAAGVPTIVHGVHIVPFDGVGFAQRQVYLAAERAAAAMTDAFINVSRGTRSLYLDAGVGRPEQHHIVQSGFELSRFRAADLPSDWRTLLDVAPTDPKPPVILMLASLEERKRHLPFLKAVPRIVSLVPDVRIVFAGEGRLRTEIEQRIAEMGLGRNVRLAGHRPDPEALIALSDVCVLTSSREGLPRVVMQSIAGGRPVVATMLPGLDEVLQHGVNSVVLGPDDFDGAADALANLLLDPRERARLAAGAVATDLSDWDVSRMGQRIEQVYRAIV